jgi:hypothetical protein
MATNLDHNPADGVQGNSPLYRFGTSPNTRSVVSQKVRILAPGYGENGSLHQIGVLANFTPNESRSIEPVRGIGFGDQVAELVPNVTDPMTATLERQLLYLSNIWQSTGYAAGVSGPMRSLKHHRWPFDIRQEIVFSVIADAEFSGVGTVPTGGTGVTAGVSPLQYTGALGGGDVEAVTGTHNVLVTYYEACWWQSWSNSGFNKDSALVTESGDVMITDVHDGSHFLMGEFANTGNDPSIGELGSLTYGQVGWEPS